MFLILLRAFYYLRYSFLPKALRRIKCLKEEKLSFVKNNAIKNVHFN